MQPETYITYVIYVSDATLYSYSFGWRTTADLFYPGTELLPQSKTEYNWSVRGLNEMAVVLEPSRHTVTVFLYTLLYDSN